jgi:uncharacterized protein
MVFDLKSTVHIATTFDLDESTWIATMRDAARESPVSVLTEGIFGRTRELYKRVSEFNRLEGADVHDELAHRPYWWLVSCGDELAKRCAHATGQPIQSLDVLIDAPPVKLEVDINMDVVMRSGVVRKLGDVSPVAESLAHRQFDNHVKRVRIFVRPRYRDILKPLLRDARLVREAIQAVQKEVV